MIRQDAGEAVSELLGPTRLEHVTSFVIRAGPPSMLDSKSRPPFNRSQLKCDEGFPERTDPTAGESAWWIQLHHLGFDVAQWFA